MDILSFINEKEIVCPLPKKWDELWKLMLKTALPKESKGLVTSQIFERFNLKPPLILGSWYFESDDAKRLRFEEQITWAKEKGILDVVENFIQELNEKDFHYFSGKSEF